MAAYTKADLVRSVSENTGLTQAKAEEVLMATLDSIRHALADGNKVTLVGFGSFNVRTRAPRPGVNPRTGEPMQIEASKGVAFRPGKGLRDAVNS